MKLVITMAALLIVMLSALAIMFHDAGPDWALGPSPTELRAGSTRPAKEPDAAPSDETARSKPHEPTAPRAGALPQSANASSVDKLATAPACTSRLDLVPSPEHWSTTSVRLVAVDGTWQSDEVTFERPNGATIWAPPGSYDVEVRHENGEPQHVSVALGDTPTELKVP